MLRELQAAWEFHLFFTSHKIPYAIIGGIAVQHWGNPRLTHDVDITAVIPVEKTEVYLDLLTSQFRVRIPDAIGVAKKHRILLLRASNGCDVDISLGLPGYEDEMIERACRLELEEGKEVFICSAEDLIVHKAVAGRARDLEDISGIIDRQGKNLDVEYIRQWLKNFSLILETDEVLNRFDKPFAEWQKWKAKRT